VQETLKVSTTKLFPIFQNSPVGMKCDVNNFTATGTKESEHYEEAGIEHCYEHWHEHQLHF